MSGIEDINAVQEALEEMTAAATDFHVTQSRVDRAADRIRRTDPIQQAAHVAGELRSGLLGIAAQHRYTCTAESCSTCEAIRHALATGLAGLRVLVDQHHESASAQIRRPLPLRRTG